MTLEEARANVGAGVVYRGAFSGDHLEDGVITSVNDRYVFVRYRGDAHSKATVPRALDLLSASPTGGDCLEAK